MGRFKFLASRRWLYFFLAVIVISTGAWWLGNWQFDRLDARNQGNDIVRANEERTAEPVGDVLKPGSEVAKDDEWRLITATGVYDPDNTLIWRYRSDPKTEVPGVDALVPLITADGTALVVNRGFVAAEGSGARDALPAAPTGTVTVEGYVRADGTGKSTKVYGDLDTRAASSATIAAATGLTTYGGWVQLKSEDPAPSEAPTLYGLPDLGQGPHFFYGIQWWFFGLLAIFGFGYLVWDEFRISQEDDAEKPREEAAVGAGPGPENSAPEVSPELTAKRAKEAERGQKINRKKALKAAYQAAYEAEKGRHPE